MALTPGHDPALARMRSLPTIGEGRTVGAVLPGDGYETDTATWRDQGPVGTVTQAR